MLGVLGGQGGLPLGAGYFWLDFLLILLDFIYQINFYEKAFVVSDNYSNIG